MGSWATTIFVLLSLSICECGMKFEDAKDLISSFKSIVDIPVSQDFKKAHRFFSFAKSFGKRTMPFAEMFATALKVGLEESQLEALLTLTNGLKDQMNSIDKQMRRIEDPAIYRNLMNEYEMNVQLFVKGFRSQIEDMSGLKMKVPASMIDKFVDDCLTVTGHSPKIIALYLENLVLRCGEPQLPTAAATQLFDLINEIKFVDYTLTTAEQHTFFQRFAVICFWLSSRLDQSSVLATFVKDRQYTTVRNKAVLLGILMDELGIPATDTIETRCLPKAAFVASGYKRNSVLRFADILMDHVSSLEYITMMCANITYYDDPDSADVYTLRTGRILEPVYQFISSWFDAITENTWPATESLLIRHIMQDVSKGSMFPELNETYAAILNAVAERMEKVGHPEQYVATRERKIGFDSKDFAYACASRACAISSGMNAHVISIRNYVNDSNVYDSLERLIEFRNSSFPVFFAAMDTELYRYYFVEKAINVLAEKYHLDFNQFTNHSSYIVLRQDVYSAGCFNALATKCDDDLEDNFLQLLSYHEDGGPFTDCEDWLVILGF